MQRGTLEALLKAGQDEQTLVTSPHVGRFRSWVRVGDLVQPGDPVGELEILGQRSPVVVPGPSPVLAVKECSCPAGWSPVDYNSTLLVLQPIGGLGELGASLVGSDSGADDLGLPPGAQPISAAIEGQFYRSPSPDDPPFISEGDIIKPGHVIGLVEVMKFFYEIHFELSGFEAGARVVHIAARDAGAIEPGDVIAYVVPA